jgi:teichuronic acid biosynthesis glycosyltransferase TuaC
MARVAAGPAIGPPVPAICRDREPWIGDQVSRLLVSAESVATNLWQSIRVTAQKLAVDFRPDVVVSYWAYPDADGALHAAQHFGVPSVVIVGGSDVRLLPRDPQYAASVKRVLTTSSMVTTVSDGLRQDSIDLGVSPDRVTTIRQGVDLTRFFPGDKARARQSLKLADAADILVWVGRMVAVKNLDLLVAAAAQVAKDRPQLELHLIGDGESRALLQARVNSEGLAKVVRFHGAVGHDKLPEWYRAADMCVLSSHSEGLPNVLRESLACGTPFVATDVGDIREIASADVSRLVHAGDVDAFAHGIVAVLDGRYRQAASMYVARTWTACAADYGSLFDTLVHGGVVVQNADRRRAVS